MRHPASQFPAPKANDKLAVRFINPNRLQASQNDPAQASPVLDADQGNPFMDVGMHHNLDRDFLFSLLVL